ncbi:MAG: alpha/beta hydrolase [Fischerella sp. CENA71]|nr:alpha/beta hydrolase [Fischerella sp. CENA71]
MIANFQFKTTTVNGEQLAYEVGGSGSPIVCFPGMGDLRQEYDRLAPVLVEAGFRVIVADLRGHGDSSVGWDKYDVVALASDIERVLNAEKIEKALLIGCSISGASTAYFAAQHPERVAGLVGLSPIRRVPFTGVKGMVMPLILQVMLMQPWGISAWGWYYRSLYPCTPPNDLAAYVARLEAKLREPGRFHAFKSMAFTGRNPAHLTTIQLPVLDFLGTADPDYDDPQAEADWLKSMMPQDEVRLLEGLGHYPHREQPERLLPHLLDFAHQTLQSNSPAAKD